MIKSLIFLSCLQDKDSRLGDRQWKSYVINLHTLFFSIQHTGICFLCLLTLTDQSLIMYFFWIKTPVLNLNLYKTPVWPFTICAGPKTEFQRMFLLPHFKNIILISICPDWHNAWCNYLIWIQRERFWEWNIIWNSSKVWRSQITLEPDTVMTHEKLTQE